MYCDYAVTGLVLWTADLFAGLMIYWQISERRQPPTGFRLIAFFGYEFKWI